MMEIIIRSHGFKYDNQLTRLRHQEKPFPFLQDMFTHISDLSQEIVPRAMWAIEVDGKFIGSAGYSLVEGDDELSFVGIMIQPEFRHLGIGQQAWTQAVEKLNARKIRRILTLIYSNQIDGLKFAADRGFSEIGRSIIAQLEIATANISKWGDPEALISQQNFRFESLNHFPQRGLADRLLPIWNRTRPDQPQHWPFVPYQARRLEREIFESEVLTLEHSFVILTAKNDIVALNLNIKDDENRLFTIYTGVDPDFRGQKLGLALKLKLIAQAQAAGIKTLATENDMSNIAMWRINQQLGFYRLQELRVYQKLLQV